MAAKDKSPVRFLLPSTANQLVLVRCDEGRPLETTGPWICHLVPSSHKISIQDNHRDPALT